MRSLVEQKRVFALLPAFFALGWILHTQVFEVKPSIALQPKSRKVILIGGDGTSHLPDQRAPASFVQNPKAVLEFDCLKPLNQFSTELSFIRMVGKNCSKVSNLLVRDVTNKITAQLFWTGKRSFSTDLFHLKKGRNNIQISYLHNGKEVSHLLLINDIR